MDILLLSISLFLFTLLFAFNFVLKPHRLNLPPGPLLCLPLIGHLHLLNHPIHRTLTNLSQKYGHVFSLRFGSRLVVVISSPSAVQECFTKNDIALANRPLLNSGKYLDYNHTVMSVSPYGEHWRNLRRIGSLEIFSTNRLNLFLGVRKEEIKCLLCKLCGDSLEDRFRVVELEPMLLDLMFNIVMKMVAGKKSFEGHSYKFKEMVTQIMAHSGATNPADFIPLWGFIDPTGFGKRGKKLAKTSDELLQELVDEIRDKEDGGNTMIHRLLSLQNTEPEYYSDQIIKGLIQDILLAGIDTIAVTLEWAMSQLLNNPEVLEKARAEIDSSIGYERLVNESDLPSLSYVQGIISETLRLHPAAPLLLPHCAFEECKIEGYDVPRDTIIFINAWAMHRDPNLWEDATSFKPERHANGMKNGAESYKLIPFGLGRRACPGLGMAQRVAGLTLASLIQGFEWERLNNSLVDMSEGKGITMPKAQPLVAKCKPRPIMKLVYESGN
ncbi:Isoflavone 2'-hydroxylase [Cucurbita argyrosperma subsp. argyrosperma]|uniref:Isoflavone 2'-hydroxylase-like n=1 Tax=Cucurbita moschata TaxID=3662 RepID=A0A6J1FXS5_CUCMO|nr:isoflavone 2'-hydroxylase-like [Cucurbita moschata]KAG7011036.1 Isoflavone 2'-hydroxylase [Cucurbita argyrosperma subsp. argyrosperma]